MTKHVIQLTVNGSAVTANVEARTQLADLLREQLLLTGTHIGCEHGVCGACTVHIDGVPARSCITYAVSCQGASVRTIEGFGDDEVMEQLRVAFSREHALQCGYCTPGMLATARDIVRRLPDADVQRIKVELSGNLCRCTGYSGIVRAVKSVLDERRQTGAEPMEDRSTIGPAGSGHGGASPLPRPEGSNGSKASPKPQTKYIAPANFVPNIKLRESFMVKAPREKVWDIFEDIEGVVSCMPGAGLTDPPQDDQISGYIRIALGPIKATFNGHAVVERDRAAFTGFIRGSGKEERGSSTSAEVRYSLLPEGDDHTRVDVEIAAAIKGPLAHFSRSNLVIQLAARLTAAFSANLAAQLADPDHRSNPASREVELNLGSVIKDSLKAYLKRAFEFLRR